MPSSCFPSSTCEQVLTLSCADAPGIVHSIATVLLEHGGNIDDSAQFRDPISARFFMRVAFSVDAGCVPAIGTSLARIADRFGMQWALRAAGTRS